MAFQELLAGQGRSKISIARPNDIQRLLDEIRRHSVIAWTTVAPRGKAGSTFGLNTTYQAPDLAHRQTKPFGRSPRFERPIHDSLYDL